MRGSFIIEYLDNTVIQEHQLPFLPVDDVPDDIVLSLIWGKPFIFRTDEGHLVYRQVVAAPLVTGGSDLFGLEINLDSEFKHDSDVESFSRQCFLKHIPGEFIEFKHIMGYECGGIVVKSAGIKVRVHRHTWFPEPPVVNAGSASPAGSLMRHDFTAEFGHSIDEGSGRIVVADGDWGAIMIYNLI